MATLLNSRSQTPAVVLAAAAWGAFAVLMWWLLAEPWELLGDGDHYLVAAQGAVAEPPFAYRLLGPWLAAALSNASGLRLTAAYSVVTALSLVTTTVLFALIGHRQGGTRRAALAAVLWTGSFAVAYSISVGVVADALYLAFVAAAVWFAGVGRGLWLVPITALGVLAHEMALFGLLAVGVDRLLGSSAVLGRTRPAWGALVVSGVAAIAVLAAVHLLTPVVEATIPNWTGTSPLGLAAWAVEYAGGPVLYVARIFAAYGPVALMALGALALRPALDRLAAVALVVALTFLATDTLRVMAMASVVVLPLAAAFLDALLARDTRRARTTAWLLIGLQATYSALVYGHLRTFEDTLVMNAAAGAVSALALLIAVWGIQLVSRPLASVGGDGRSPSGEQIDLVALAPVRSQDAEKAPPPLSLR